MKLLLIALASILFCSCSGSMSYSPLDNYIAAGNHGDSANAAYKVQMKRYLDSVNAAIIVIHNKY